MENFIQQVKALSSAEDFLQFFGVPFEQSVVNVSRLHILKRFSNTSASRTCPPAWTSSRCSRPTASS